eukprot:CAMPEP_0119101480 /NCGR_PEP_ID=MMETSP1180-20130426/519_1 /TAXON_ID=3052 ORGANISM="Chlamydomonas cf sp, Strain CCMP681" /NCGR_SAMPLE_ID=MMETSP1180 /ASSEMBLY_ACC=CAM_ASM_000741 /LENGTH=288 /DNA_ID=CAMNT_0007085605 /DNA_START=112 /DNA_END=978 /DNA_ORIENTATION=+
MVYLCLVCGSGDTHALTPIVPISLIAVGSPMFIHGKCAHRFMQSIFNGTVHPAEIIIVIPNFREHDAAAIVKFESHWRDHFKFLRVFQHMHQGNKGGDWNIAVALATYDIVSIFDVDDIQTPNRLEVLYKVMVAHTELAAVLHLYSFIDYTWPVINQSLSGNMFVFHPGQLNTEYKKHGLSPNNYCCKFLGVDLQVHNGWITFRKSKNNLTYDVSAYRWEDTHLFARMNMAGLATNVINASLGLYNVDSDRNSGRCPRTPYQHSKGDAAPAPAVGLPIRPESAIPRSN